MSTTPQPPKKPQPEMVVAVQSLTPEFCLWNSATGTLRRVIGGNLKEDSVYLEPEPEARNMGMPKEFRMAAEDGNYHDEYLPHPLPNYIEELVLSENPECKLVITDCKVIEIYPKSEPAMCKMIEHPAVKFNKTKSKAPKPPKLGTGTGLFPFAQPDYPTIQNRIA